MFYRNIKIKKVTNFRTLGGADRWRVVANAVMNLQLPYNVGNYLTG
jgi:hypothetical protein